MNVEVAEKNPDISIIWLSKPKSMEISWIKFLLGKFEFELIFGKKLPTSRTKKAIVVTHWNQSNSFELTCFLETLIKENFKLGLFHLGDEFLQDDITFYKYFNFVFRNYYKSEVASSGNVYFFPLGYKSGFHDELVPKDFSSRQYLWSFAGQQNRRLEMIKAASNLKRGLLITTKTFNDSMGLSTQEYADLLGNTKVALCPRGASFDCFRVYEALESGAIPLVEDDGGLGFLSEVWGTRGLDPLLKDDLIESLRQFKRRAFHRKSYWQQAYGKGFPCPRIYKWQNLKVVLSKISLDSKHLQIQTWWNEYKKRLVDNISTLISTL